MDLCSAFQVSFSYLRLLKLFNTIRKNKKRYRRWWVRPHIHTNVRNKYGTYATQFQYFKAYDHEKFHSVYRLTVEQFVELHEMLRQFLEKSFAVREPLHSEMRLALTLHFLARGDSIKTLAMSYYVGESTAYEIINTVVILLWEILAPVFLSEKTVENWKEIAEAYFVKWGFPNCIGALDGKHIRIIKPPKSGSCFFNYKKHYSFVLMATCDAHYRFTWIDVGDYGSLSDASVFGATGFAAELEEKRYPLPEPTPLPDSNDVLPYFFIGDEGFKLASYLIRPYPRRSVTTNVQELFNNCLSHARMTIEDTFGILSNRWRVLRTEMALKLDTSVNVVKALACLHNFILTKELNEKEECKRYVTEELLQTIREEYNNAQATNDIAQEDEEEAEDIRDVSSIGQHIRNTLSLYFERQKKN